MLPSCPGLTIEAITPAIAQAYLRTLKFPQPGDYTLVFQHAEEMRNGTWEPLSHALGFARDGRLINGRSYLYAVILSGTTQMFGIVRREGD